MFTWVLGNLDARTNGASGLDGIKRAAGAIVHTDGDRTRISGIREFKDGAGFITLLAGIGADESLLAVLVVIAGCADIGLALGSEARFTDIGGVTDFSSSTALIPEFAGHFRLDVGAETLLPRVWKQPERAGAPSFTTFHARVGIWSLATDRQAKAADTNTAGLTIRAG